MILSGVADGGLPGSKKLIEGEWRNSSYAEYVKLPLENCHVFDEKLLCGSVADGGRGYAVEQLSWVSAGLVPYGGFRSINLQAGETVIIAPATGRFGGAAVVVALSMGARVIAMGRNAEALSQLQKLSDRVLTVQIIGDSEKELTERRKFGPVDAFLDISPSFAQTSTHIKSGILSLREEGLVCFMGGFLKELPIPHMFIMRRSITLQGKWMYSRQDVVAMFKLIERGIISLGHVKAAGVYPLEDWEKAFKFAAENTAVGHMTLLKP